MLTSFMTLVTYFIVLLVRLATLGCFKIAPLSNFLTAQQISDGVLAADYEFDIIF